MQASCLQPANQAGAWGRLCAQGQPSDAAGLGVRAPAGSACGHAGGHRGEVQVHVDAMHTHTHVHTHGMQGDTVEKCRCMLTQCTHTHTYTHMACGGTPWRSAGAC
eukprot:1159565-Pelagomonas_calceolata.AAC.6